MPEPFGTAFRRARVEAGLSIRAVAEAAGVSTATVQRAEGDADTMRGDTLRKLAEAVGIPRPTLDPSGVRWVVTEEPHIAHLDPKESRNVVTEGRNVLVLDVPPGFLDNLDADRLDEIKQDALLEVMRLARAAKRERGEQARGREVAG